MHFRCNVSGSVLAKLFKLLLGPPWRLAYSDIDTGYGRIREFDELLQRVGTEPQLCVHRK
jgi:hypothetical protein